MLSNMDKVREPVPRLTVNAQGDAQCPLCGEEVTILRASADCRLYADSDIYGHDWDDRETEDFKNEEYLCPFCLGSVRPALYKRRKALP